jgi:hypothetical protein
MATIRKIAQFLTVLYPGDQSGVPRRRMAFPTAWPSLTGHQCWQGAAMDGRVKPGHDRAIAFGLASVHASARAIR